MKRKMIGGFLAGLCALGLLALVLSRHLWTNDLEKQVDEVRARGNIPLVAIFPMTGSYGYVGELADWSARYAVEQLNAGGGINGRKTELIICNSASNTENARKIVREAGKSALILIGPATAPEVLAVAEDIRANEMIDLGVYSFDEGLEKAVPYGISYMSNSDRGEWSCIQKWSQDNPDIRRVVIFTDTMDASKKVTADTLVEKLPQIGLEAVAVVDISKDQTSQKYMKCAIQGLNQEADGYISLLSTEDYANVLCELRRRGVDDGRRITASFSAYSEELIDLAGENLDGTYIWNKFDPAYNSDAWERLTKAYQQDHHGEMPMSTIVVDIYDSVMILKDCFEALDITGRAEVYEAEKSEIARWFFDVGSVDGIQGSYYWENGEKMKDYVYFIFDGATPVAVDGCR